MKSEAATGKTRGRPRSFDRDQALEQAMLVFWRNGYEATSLHDLTAAMGINPPSLYAAFGDKEQLFLEAVGRYLGQGGSPECTLDAPPSARVAIAQLLDQLARDRTNPSRPRGCMVVLSAVNCTAGSARVQAALASIRSEWEAWMTRRIERARAEGEVPPATDAAALASFYMTVLEGMSIQARDGASRQRLQAVAAAAMRAWPAAAAPVARGKKAPARRTTR